jgi:hypothetical protein
VSDAPHTSHLRPQQDIVRAHDLLVGIMLDQCPFPDAGLTRRDLSLMTNVLCWCLHHADNQQFAKQLHNIDASLRAMGYGLTERS